MPYYFVVILSMLAGVPSCKEGAKKNSGQTVAVEDTPKGRRAYNLSNGDPKFLPKKLKEISGIYYQEGDRFLGIQDEQGIIYTIDYQSGEIIAELPFGGRGDFEDITMDAANYYVLESSGNIHKVPKGDGSATKVFNFPGGKNDFETVYLDAGGENLVIICKECGDGGGTTINAYAFNLAKEEFGATPLFSISGAGVTKGAGGKRAAFRPSAAAIHPIEKKLYVLCSVGRTLLVCDLQGTIEDQYSLDASLYQQPEGIAFKPNGELFISNEAGNGRANILKILYNPG